MKPTDYSIEFCHIYLNETFSTEHELSISVVKELIQKFDLETTYSLNVLVDDYNATEQLLDLEDFKKRLKDEGTKPDYLASEARLAHYANVLLDQMRNGKLKKSYERYIFDKGFVPCSFMIAIWYLLRLGLIEQEQDFLVYEKNGGHSKSFIGKKLISVLPERFRGVEDKASAIIKATPFASRLEDIDHIYYDGAPEKVVINAY